MTERTFMNLNVSHSDKISKVFTIRQKLRSNMQLKKGVFKKVPPNVNSSRKQFRLQECADSHRLTFVDIINSI
jgi:hypothetical protein